ncbi:MAG: hypothetical protein WBA66_00415 [Xanthobacteraceae bacterium]
MNNDAELLALGRLLDEAALIALDQTESEIGAASAVPDAIARRIMAIASESGEGSAVKAKAIAWARWRVTGKTTLLM